MSKVKLDLQSKTDDQLSQFAAEHKAAILKSPHFPAPVPSAADFDGSLLAFSGKLEEIAAAEIALQTLRAERETLRKALEANLTARGGHVDSVSGGDQAKIVSAGFQVQAVPTPTTSLPAPGGVFASMGDSPGEIDLGCDAVPRAKMYLIEQREHSDTAVPGAWQQAKITAKSSATLGGLTSGKRYAFRLRALGPNDIQSPWSDEAVCMAP